MQLDLHVSRFDWAGGPSGIAEGVAGLAARAEGVGIKTLSFMDHFFQMDWMAPAEDPMLECYTALAFVAGRTQTLRLRALVTGVTYRHPGILAKTITTLDVVSQGRASSASARRGTSASTAGSACRSRRLRSASSDWRRRSRSASRCGATTTARTAGSTTSSRRRCAARRQSARRGRAS